MTDVRSRVVPAVEGPTGYPLFVNVGTNRWQVIVDHAVMKRAEKQAKTSMFGFCDGMTMSIAIHPNLPTDRAVTTLWHESLHASVGEVLNLGSEDEEQLVLVFTPIIVQLIRDNPKLVALTQQV